MHKYDYFVVEGKYTTDQDLQRDTNNYTTSVYEKIHRLVSINILSDKTYVLVFEETEPE